MMTTPGATRSPLGRGRMHASCPPRHHFAAPVTSRLRCRHKAGTRSAPAAWRRLCCSASLLDTLAAVNAEALARKEGSEQVGAKTGIAPLTSVPVEVAEAKASACAKLLEKLGCLSLTGALSPESCRSLLAYVNDENARSQAAVLTGNVAFDSRFGGVNLLSSTRTAPGFILARHCFIIFTLSRIS